MPVKLSAAQPLFVANAGIANAGVIGRLQIADTPLRVAHRGDVAMAR